MANHESIAGERATAASDDGFPAPGAIFELLADEPRRLVVYLLRARGGTTAVDELATTLLAHQAERGDDLLPADTEPAVAVYLHHVVVPELAEHGVVTYDRQDRAVTFAACDGLLEPYLEFARGREPPAVDRFVERFAARSRPGVE